MKHFQLDFVNHFSMTHINQMLMFADDRLVTESQFWRGHNLIKKSEPWLANSVILTFLQTVFPLLSLTAATYQHCKGQQNNKPCFSPSLRPRTWYTSYPDMAEKASWPLLCGCAAQRKTLEPCCELSWESTFENVLQPNGAEVEFHVCNYRTTGCKGSIWPEKEKHEGGVGRDVLPGWKVKKRQQNTSQLCLCLLYSKRNRQAILWMRWNNIEGVHIREKNNRVNKCRWSDAYLHNERHSLVQQTARSTM